MIHFLSAGSVSRHGGPSSSIPFKTADSFIVTNAMI